MAVAPALVLVGWSAVSDAAGSYKLLINGASVSTAARQIGGRTYVPVDDVARALGMKASVKGTNISIRPAGGTYAAPIRSPTSSRARRAKSCFPGAAASKS